MSPLKTKTEQEARFLEITKKFDHGLEARDLSLWDNIIADDAVLHADGYTFQHDKKGREEIKKYYQSYIDQYDFEHKSVAGAASDVDGDLVSFSLSVDKHVKPKQGKYEEQHKKGEVEDSDTAGIHHFKFNADGKIQEIYFLRQLSRDEQHRKMKYLIDYSHLNFNVDEYEGAGDIKPSAERASKHRDIATKYNSMWDDNVDAADDIFAEDAHIYNLNSGQERSGKDTFKKIVRGMLQDWERQEGQASIATSAGNKAFVYWSTKGTFKGEQSTVYGLTFLVFNKDDKIEELATLMQPFPSQRAATLKTESAADIKSRETERSSTSEEGKTVCYKESETGRVIAERTDYKDVKKAEIYEARPKAIVYEERLKEEVWEKVPVRTVQEVVVTREVAPKDVANEFHKESGEEKVRTYTKPAHEKDWNKSRVEEKHEEANFRTVETKVESEGTGNMVRSEYKKDVEEKDGQRVVAEHTEYEDRKKGVVIESRPKETIYEERVKEEIWEKVPVKTTQTVEVTQQVTKDVEAKGEGATYTKKDGEEVGETQRVFTKPSEGEWKTTRTEGSESATEGTRTVTKKEEGAKWEETRKENDTWTESKTENTGATKVNADKVDVQVRRVGA